MKARVDAHLILPPDCGGEIDEIRREGFDLIMAEVGGTKCLKALAAELLRGGFRTIVYGGGGGGAPCPGVCPHLGRIGEGADIVLVSLAEDDVGDVVRELRRRPNRVKALVVDFSEIRHLWEVGELDLAKVRGLIHLGLDHHAPLLVGSGARRASEILGARTLTSVLRALEPGYNSKADYRRLLSYLYDQAAVMEVGDP